MESRKRHRRVDPCQTGYPKPRMLGNKPSYEKIDSLDSPFLGRGSTRGV